MEKKMKKEERFQLLNEADKPFRDDKRITQIKVDGRLVRVEKLGDKVTFTGRDFIPPSNFPEAMQAIKDIPFDFKADTEFACFNGIKSNFGQLQTRSKLKDNFKIRLLTNMTPVTPTFFDLLEFNGQQLINEPYEKRKKILNEKFHDLQGIKVVKDWKDPFEAWKFVEEHQLEGIVEKEKDAHYKVGRNSAGIKIKRKETSKIVFTGYETNPKGITLTNGGLRCSCLGEQHKKVKEHIDTFGEATVIVRHMAGRTKNNKLREIVFYKMEVKDGEMDNKETGGDSKQQR